MSTTTIVAVRDAAGVKLTWYSRGGAIVAQTVLTHRRAALIGMHLLTLSLEPRFCARRDTGLDPAIADRIKSDAE
jgi:hypothetical protein